MNIINIDDYKLLFNKNGRLIYWQESKNHYILYVYDDNNNMIYKNDSIYGEFFYKYDDNNRIIYERCGLTGQEYKYILEDSEDMIYQYC